MNDTVLSISLLNERFSATAVHRGGVAGTWERPAPIADVADLSSVLRDAVKQTAYAGTPATVVIAHQRLAQQLVETPPLKGQNLKSFLQRRVKQLKPFPADAAWSYQPTLPTRNGQAVLLHLLPKPFLDPLVQAGDQADLKITRVIPATAVLQRQLAALPLEKDEVALLAAETGGTTTVVIGRKDGQIYLGRTLGNDWNTHADRVGVDINRTILYVKQQFGVTVGSVWFFGAGAANQLRAMQTTLRLPVKLSPVEPGPFYWNQESLKIAVDDTSNLISSEQLQAPRRRALLKVTGVAVGSLAAAALVLAVSVQLLAMDRARQLRTLQSKVEQMQERRARLQDRERQFLQQKNFLKVVTEEKVEPVPGWFLGYLGNALPEELLLTQFRLKREDDEWRLQLGGSLQPTTNQAPAAVVLDAAVTTLKKTLSEGPFHVRILGDEERKSGAATTATAVVTPPAMEQRFSVEGVMKAR
jgi:hypothetical protein